VRVVNPFVEDEAKFLKLKPDLASRDLIFVGDYKDGIYFKGYWKATENLVEAFIEGSEEIPLPQALSPRRRPQGVLRHKDPNIITPGKGRPRGIYGKSSVLYPPLKI